jgi:sugar-specific transcriptional regulator TrmB
MEDALIQLGFSQHEATIYLALIDLGKTGTGEIIRKTGLHRNIVYETLDKLIRRKLVFKIANKKVAQFELADPARILAEVRAKTALAEQIVPELASRANIKQEVVIYDGLEGFRASSMDFIERMSPSSTIYVLGAIGDRWYQLMGNKALQHDKLRLKKRIVMREILYGKESMEIDNKMASNKANLYEIRVIPQEFETPANMLIVEDMIILQTLIEPYSAVQIKNPALSQAYLNYFNAMWEQAEEIS